MTNPGLSSFFMANILSFNKKLTTFPLACLYKPNLDYYREVYECRKCRKNGASHIEKSPMVDPVIPHSYASATSVAYVMYQKFVNALPLYRLEKEWKNLGLNLSRATMANWIMIASKERLNPIVEEMHRKISTCR